MWATILPMIMNMLSSSQQQGQQQGQQAKQPDIQFGPTQQPMRYSAGNTGAGYNIQPSNKFDLTKYNQPQQKQSSGMNMNMIMKLIMGLISAKGGGGTSNIDMGGLTGQSSYGNTGMQGFDWGSPSYSGMGSDISAGGFDWGNLNSVDTSGLSGFNWGG